MIALYLTFLGFILAFQALVNRKRLFRLRTSWLDQRKLYYLVIFLGIFPVVQYLHQTIMPLSESITKILQPYWWTIKGGWYISLIFILIYLSRILIKSAKYTNRNCKYFFYECQDIIFKGDIIEISDLSLELLPNTREILNTYSNSSENIYSLRLIALFSDPIFVKVTTTRNAQFCYDILSFAIDCSSKPDNVNLKNSPIEALVNQVLRHLIIEPDSYLQRENPNEGLGHFMHFRKLIFSNIDFITGPFQPLTGWLKYNEDILDENSLSKYIEIVRYFFSEYLKEKESNPDIFIEVLCILKNIVRFEPVSERKVFEIGFFIRRLIGELEKIKADLPEEELKVKLSHYTRRFDYKDLYSILANGIFEILELLSRNQDHYETIRLTLLEIFDFSQSDNDAIKAIKYRLSILIDMKIKENMEDRVFPQVIAAIVYTYELCEPAKCEHEFHRTAMQLLKANFIEFYQDAPENARAMLPDIILVDIDNEQLIRKKRVFGKHISEPKLKLEKPRVIVNKNSS